MQCGWRTPQIGLQTWPFAHATMLAKRDLGVAPYWSKFQWSPSSAGCLRRCMIHFHNIFRKVLSTSFFLKKNICFENLTKNDRVRAASRFSAGVFSVWFPTPFAFAFALAFALPAGAVGGLTWALAAFATPSKASMTSSCGTRAFRRQCQGSCCGCLPCQHACHTIRRSGHSCVGSHGDRHPLTINKFAPSGAPESCWFWIIWRIFICHTLLAAEDGIDFGPWLFTPKMIYQFVNACCNCSLVFVDLWG